MRHGEETNGALGWLAIVEENAEVDLCGERLNYSTVGHVIDGNRQRRGGCVRCEDDDVSRMGTADRTFQLRSLCEEFSVVTAVAAIEMEKDTYIHRLELSS